MRRFVVTFKTPEGAYMQSSVRVPNLSYSDFAAAVSLDVGADFQDVVSVVEIPDEAPYNFGEGGADGDESFPVALIRDY